jgi:plasmid stabilization system protein ParE
MTRIIRSALFKRQLIEITVSYRDRAGSEIALKFVDRVEEAITFISQYPEACAIYGVVAGKEFRKWRLDGFPVSVFFRRMDHDTVILEALYSHRMNILSRFSNDIG